MFLTDMQKIKDPIEWKGGYVLSLTKPDLEVEVELNEKVAKKIYILEQNFILK